MKTIYALAFMLVAFPAYAGCDIYGGNCGKTDVYGQRRDNPNYQRSWGNPRPATGPADRSTFGNPRQVEYPHQPTFGDTRTGRRTNPAKCRSLLCD